MKETSKSIMCLRLLNLSGAQLGGQKGRGGVGGGFPFPMEKKSLIVSILRLNLPFDKMFIELP